MRTLLWSLWRDEAALSIAEYAVLMAVLAIMAMTAWETLDSQSAVAGAPASR